VKHLNNRSRPIPFDHLIFSTYAFDSVFTAARVLDKTSKTSWPPENFTYGSRDHYKIIKSLLQEEDFEGVSVNSIMIIIMMMVMMMMVMMMVVMMMVVVVVMMMMVMMMMMVVVIMMIITSFIFNLRPCYL